MIEDHEDTLPHLQHIPFSGHLLDPESGMLPSVEYVQHAIEEAEKLLALYEQRFERAEEPMTCAIYYDACCNQRRLLYDLWEKFHKVAVHFN